MTEIVNRGKLPMNAAAASNVNLFTNNITPNSDCSSLRMTVSVSTSATCSLFIVATSASYVVDFDKGTALAASALYTYTWGVTNARDYNIRFVKSTTVIECQVDEVYGGVI